MARTPPPAKPRPRRAPVWTPGALWNRLSNMRFALWLLLGIALGGVLGTVVSDAYPTNAPNWERLAEQKAGPALFPILKFFEMFDPFRSWWFRALVGLLMLSLTACAIKRGRGVWRRALFLSWLDQPRFYERYDHRAMLESKSDDPFAPIVAPLRRTLYRVQVREAAGGARLLAADRGGFCRFGPFLTHVGLLLLLVGGGVMMVWGLKTMLWLGPGESADALHIHRDDESSHDAGQHPLPFAIKVNDFQVELNDQGMVKQYRSDVTVTPKAGAAFDYRIEVNHPLRFAGYNFYQASYQPAYDQVARLTVAPVDSAGHDQQAPVAVRFGERFPLGGGLEAEAVRFFCDARVGQGGLQNVSFEHRNPAFLFRVTRDGQEVGTQWSFVAFPTMRIGTFDDMGIAVRGYDPAYATGLEVTRAPMAGLVWLGIILCSLGLILTFNVAHRQLWALAEPDGKGGWTVHVAAFTNRASLLFAGDFRRWAERWAKSPAVRNLRVHAPARAKETLS